MTLLYRWAKLLYPRNKILSQFYIYSKGTNPDRFFISKLLDMPNNPIIVLHSLLLNNSPSAAALWSVDEKASENIREVENKRKE